MNLIKHPRFDDIVNKYISEKHPDWVLNATNYNPGINNPGTKQSFTENFRENFGSKYASTICSDIKNYIIFFIVSLVIYMFLSLIVKR
jgi:hypothetical protein